ncbi:MAG: hypothetical protein JWL69_4491 [Phycisphaerales bacterium]|nr:hypothetical protein [Phycisphaerales bacterium]
MTFVPRYTLRPSVRSLLVGFLVHRNPFYLLSALCMVAGCFALNSGLAPRTAEVPKLLVLLGTLNVYEAMVVALGLFLIRRRRLLRDGRTLLLIEAPFLVDLTFLNAETGSVSLKAGALLSSLVLLLALLKVGVVLRILGNRLPRRAFAFISLELATLLMLPTVFKWFESRGTVTGSHFYLAWWAAGLLLAGYEILNRSRAVSLPDAGLTRTIRRLYTALPLVSLIAHVGMLHWVYWVRFSAADLSPMLLGAAVAMGYFPTKISRPNFTLLRALLPAAAVGLAVTDPLPFHVHLLGRVDLTSPILAIAAAYVAYVYCFFLSYAPLLLGGGVAAFMAFAIGPSFGQIADGGRAGSQRLLGVAMKFVPRTALQWGVVAMSAAFAFLGIGAFISLRKGAPPTAEPVQEHDATALL